MAPVPLQLINLPEASLRLTRMAAQLDARGLAYERLGCDFRRTGRDDIIEWFAGRYGSIRPGTGRLSAPELGCWASHLSAWSRIAASGGAAGTVIEDDVVLASDFADCVRALERDSADFDIVYLGTSSRNLSTRRVADVGGLRIHTPVGTVLNTWGYVVRSRWIDRLFAAGPLALTMPIDHFLGGRAPIVRPRVGVLQPPCVEEDAVTARASQIAPHTWRIDRLRAVEATRRRLLRSRAGDWLQRLYARL
jgi:glycosyl transferase family 25